MSEPTIEIIPSRPAARADQVTTMDLLIRITPPMPEVHFVRPPINLGLVLDRSGSMAGAKKMDYAKQAACLAVEQLLPTDRLSMTIFDDMVETIAANAPVTNKPDLIKAIKAIEPRNSTDLHGGWKEGGRQVEQNLIHHGLNRVILLSDGLANHGTTAPEVIAGESRALAARGVTTSTMGLGSDYNEDLMQAMGEAGDGNYYFIESPLQLVDIFQTELQGLMANLGQRVTLGLDGKAGATLVEVFNEMERNVEGHLILPNLVVGMPISIVLRIKVPALPVRTEAFVLTLAWDEPNSPGRKSMQTSLWLVACPSADWETLPRDLEVAEQVALQMAARAKKEAMAAYDRGDLMQTRAYVEEAREEMLAMPSSPTVSRELEEIAKLHEDLEQGQGAVFRKRSALQRYSKKRGQDF